MEIRHTERVAAIERAKAAFVGKTAGLIHRTELHPHWEFYDAETGFLVLLKESGVVWRAMRTGLLSVSEIIAVAAKHHSTNGSADLCYRDALDLYEKSDTGAARKRALASLAHSVGVFHEDYRRAAR